MKKTTENRKRRICEVLRRKQADLTLVMNNIHDPHNVSAILRSCDAFGILTVHLLYTTEPFPSLGKRSSASAKKWIETKRHQDSGNLVRELKSSGHQILTTGFGKESMPLTEYDFTLPTAVILGNEHRGVDEEISMLVPDKLYIPMQGMVQSLNVSVAAAVILYEAWRQRLKRGTATSSTLPEEELDARIRDWCTR
ncbi:MAG: TrmH family RNA methyltransferase [Desulfovibrionales bacterium]